LVKVMEKGGVGSKRGGGKAKDSAVAKRGEDGKNSDVAIRVDLG
jgi:hypothetical protein